LTELEEPVPEPISPDDPYASSKRLHALEQTLLFQAEKFVRELKAGRGYGKWRLQLISMQETMIKLQLESAPPEDEAEIKKTHHPQGNVKQ
jgi:hypothetical protein